MPTDTLAWALASAGRWREAEVMQSALSSASAWAFLANWQNCNALGKNTLKPKPFQLAQQTDPTFDEQRRAPGLDIIECLEELKL